MKPFFVALQYRLYRSLSSIATQYFFFVFIAPLLLLGITVLVGWLNYTSLQQQRHYQYWKESDIISEVVLDTFNTTGILLDNLQNHITTSSSLDAIALAIRDICYRQQPVNAATLHCVFIDHSNTIHSYQAANIPSDLIKHIQLSELSHTQPIAVKLSAQDTQTFIAFIADIAHANSDLSGQVMLFLPSTVLTQKIENRLSDPSISYFITNEAGIIVSESYTSRIRAPQHRISLSDTIHTVKQLPKDNGHLEHAIIDDFLEYYFFQTIYPYKYIALIGENTYIAKRELMQKIMPHIIQTLAIGSFLILLLYFFQRILIRPIMLLSKAADNIASQQKKVTFPHSTSYEVNNLVQALINIRRSFIHEEQLKMQLTKATNEAEEANKAKSQFLANMSHELRTPLGAIIGFAELLTLDKTGKLNDEQKSFVNIIYSSGKHLLNIINDILNLSKIEAGRMEVHEQECNVKEIADNCLEYMKELANDAKVTLETRYPPIDVWIHGDEMKIKQMIINLLSNAIKFTPSDGHVSIIVEQTPHDGTRISVVDTGIGIAEHDIHTILEEYGQVGSAYARRKDQGTGLGLAIVKKFTELHQAEFIIESTINVGTKVTIHFPRERTIMTPSTD